VFKVVVRGVLRKVIECVCVLLAIDWDLRDGVVCEGLVKGAGVSAVFSRLKIGSCISVHKDEQDAN
jgi:hypothetical protein